MNVRSLRPYHFVLLAGTLVTTACGSNGTTAPVVASPFLTASPSATAIPSATASPSATLAAASVHTCVYPATAMQTVPLPSTSQVSGSMTLGAFAAASSTCMTLTVATGMSASANARRTAATLRPLADSAPQPLLSVSLYDASTSSAVIGGVTLNVPLPDGTYPATVTIDYLGAPVVTNYSITITGGVTVSAGGLLSKPIPANGIGTLAVYAIGTELPTPMPLPSPTPASSASATPTPSATATAAPTVPPTPEPTPTSTPPPTPVPSGTVTVAIAPSVCTHYDNGGGGQGYVGSASDPAPHGMPYVYAFRFGGYPPTSTTFTADSPPTFQFITDQGGSKDPNVQYGVFSTTPKATFIVNAWSQDMFGQVGSGTGTAVATVYIDRGPATGTNHYLTKVGDAGETVTFGPQSSCANPQ